MKNIEELKSWFEDEKLYVGEYVKHKIDQLDEPELSVIPKFVAEWYESEGKRNSWWNWFYKWGRDEGRTELETKTIRWMQYFNEEAFVNMFLHGYTVEKEQKYYALIKGHENIGSDDKYWNYCITDESLDIGDNKVHADVLAEYVLSATKDEWENLGINDDNADFVEVEELEE